MSDGLIPPLNAPPAGQVVPGVQPGVSSGQVFATQVIVFGPSGAVSGVFLYSPGTTPALGNPPVIALTSSPKDPFGNVITAGDQLVNTTPYLIVQDSAGRYIQLATAASFGAFLSLGTADAAEHQPGIMNGQVVGAGATRQLSTTITSPMFNFAGQGTTMQLLSGSADGTSLGSQWSAVSNDGLGGLVLKGDANGNTTLQVGNNTQTNSLDYLEADKAAHTGRTATALLIDPDLQFTVFPGAKYEITCTVGYQLTTAANINLNYDFQLPSGTFTYICTRQGPALATGADTTAQFTAGTPGAAFTGTSGNNQGMQIKGLLRTGVTGGTFGLLWAPAAVPVNNMNLNTDSCLIARRIA